MVVEKLPVNARPAKSSAEPLFTVNTPVPLPRSTSDVSCKMFVVEPVPIPQLIEPEIAPPV